MHMKSDTGEQPTGDHRVGGSNPSNILQLSDYFPFQVALISATLREELGKSCAAENISINDWRVIAMIANHPGLVARELVRKARLSEVNVHRAIKKMISMELVLRTSGEDRRQKILSLTPKGKEVYQRIVPAAYRLEKAVLELLPEGERDQVLHGIAKIFTSLLSSQDILADAMANFTDSTSDPE